VNMLYPLHELNFAMLKVVCVIAMVYMIIVSLDAVSKRDGKTPLSLLIRYV
jgi:hypothetical protein